MLFGILWAHGMNGATSASMSGIYNVTPRKKCRRNIVSFESLYEPEATKRIQFATAQLPHAFLLKSVCN